MLKLQVKTSSHKDPIWIVDAVIKIGSSDKNDIVITDDSIKEFHAQILLNDTVVTVKDVSSGGELSINGSKVEDEPQEVKAEDIIKIGDIEIEVVDGQSTAHEASSLSVNEGEWSLVSNNSWLDGQVFSLKESTTMGRGTNCDITIPGTHLSRQHCELSIIANKLHIRDTSSNGTFLNERKITTAEAQPGDILKIDVYSFQVAGPQEAVDANKTQLRPVQASTGAPRRRTAKNTEKTEEEKEKEKEWKTKSSSPGNREPTEPDSAKNNTVYMMMGFAVIGVLLFILFW